MSELAPGLRRGSTPDPRPQFRLAAFGLPNRLERLLQIVVRHARFNPYRFVLADARGPGDYDVALVDMTVKGGPEVASTIRRLPESRPVVTVGRRDDPTRLRDDLLLQRFTTHLLETLNRVVARDLQKPAARAAADLVASMGGTAEAGVLARLYGRRARVLLIDPSLPVRRQLALALGPIGVDVEGVGKATEALDVLALRGYDLVILEATLPDHDGLTLIRRIRKQPRAAAMPVIVLTVRSSPLDLFRGVLSGCDCYLVKPVTLPTLRQSVVRGLQRSAARHPAAADQATNSAGNAAKRSTQASGATAWQPRPLAGGAA